MMQQGMPYLKMRVKDTYDDKKESWNAIDCTIPPKKIADRYEKKK